MTIKYQGLIVKADNERLDIVFENPVKIKHELGSVRISKISLRYEVVKQIHPDWAAENPVCDETLIGRQVPVSSKTLYKIVDNYHQKNLTSAIEAITNND